MTAETNKPPQHYQLMVFRAEMFSAQVDIWVQEHPGLTRLEAQTALKRLRLQPRAALYDCNAIAEKKLRYGGLS